MTLWQTYTRIHTDTPEKKVYEVHYLWILKNVNVLLPCESWAWGQYLSHICFYLFNYSNGHTSIIDLCPPIFNTGTVGSINIIPSLYCMSSHENQYDTIHDLTWHDITSHRHHMSSHHIQIRSHHTTSHPINITSHRHPINILSTSYQHHLESRRAGPGRKSSTRACPQDSLYSMSMWTWPWAWT